MRKEDLVTLATLEFALLPEHVEYATDTSAQESEEAESDRESEGLPKQGPLLRLSALRATYGHRSLASRALMNSG